MKKFPDQPVTGCRVPVNGHKLGFSVSAAGGSGVRKKENRRTPNKE
jgi:hypothetical protein